MHTEIRQEGAGRYSFWHQQVYFSASDNSDPRTNGRRYAFEYTPLFFRFLRRLYAILYRLAGPGLASLHWLREPIVKTSVGRKWIHNEISNICPETGYCYMAWVGLGGPSSHRHPSRVRLLEDGVPLPGPANAAHDEIRLVGAGRYSFWKSWVYFSTSDNSDPRTNGRHYMFDRTPLKKRLKEGVLIVFHRYGFVFWDAFYWVCFYRVLRHDNYETSFSARRK
jgi:hypothetical protein